MKKLIIIFFYLVIVGVSIIDSPSKMSDNGITEYQKTATQEVVARNYLLSYQKECTELQEKQNRILKLREEMDTLQKEMDTLQKEVDFITRQHELQGNEVESAQKVVEEAERKQRERSFLFQVGPYLQECRNYLLDSHDFSGYDDDEIMVSLEHAGLIRDGVRLMLEELRSHSLVKEEHLVRYDPVLIIALTHALYYCDQDFVSILSKLERITLYSSDYGVPGSIIVNRNEEYPGDIMTSVALDCTPSWKFPLAIVPHSTKSTVELKSHKEFLEEFWKFDNLYQFRLSASLRVV